MAAPELARTQAEAAYRRMAEEVRYRPEAPSGAFGEIQVPEDQLDLSAEAATFAERWWEREESEEISVGVPDAGDRVALILVAEGARQLTATHRDLAAKLLRLAAEELENRGS